MSYLLLNQRSAIFLKCSSLFFSLIFICGAARTDAQTGDRRIEEIRRIYQETNEQIADAEKHFDESSIYLTELIVNQGGTMYPAVGIFRNTIRFYYTFGDREEHPYPNRLLKITVSTKRSSQHESSEYLFDHAGQLIFYLEKTGEDAEESRFYFASGKIIRIMRGRKIVDINSRQELYAPKAVQAQADKLIAIFQHSLEN